jgi:hypothetical protein
VKIGSTSTASSSPTSTGMLRPSSTAVVSATPGARYDVCNLADICPSAGKIGAPPRTQAPAPEPG